eukprot:2355169-Prymnesium_polylepis.1
MFTARVALSQEGGTKCPTARKSCAHPTFLTFTPPHTPRGPLSAMATLGHRRLMTRSRLVTPCDPL